MSGLDLGIILMTIAGAFLGMKIGAVAAFFNVMGGFVGGWAAARYYLSVMALSQMDTTPAYMLVFLVSAGIFVGAGVVVSHFLEPFFLGLVDKFLGALLGMGLSLVLVTAMFLPVLLEQTSSARKLFRRSAFAPYLMRTMQTHLELAPENVWQTLEPSIQSEAVLKVRRMLETSSRFSRKTSYAPS